MQILRKLYGFNIPTSDLVKIYTIYIRSFLEVSCVVWASSITQEEETSLERVQKIALRIILDETYMSYENDLEKTNLQTLRERREILSLKFAKNTLKYEETRDIFPENPTTYDIQRTDQKQREV